MAKSVGGIIRRKPKEFSGIVSEGDRTDYNRDYYSKNKDTISEARRKKYNENPVIRERLRAKSMEYYNKYKKKDSIVGYSVKEADGQKLYTIKYLAKSCGYTAEYIRTLEKRGILPQPMYVDKRGWRFYTKLQLELVLTAIGYWRSNQWEWEQVSGYLFSHWEDSNE